MNTRIKYPMVYPCGHRMAFSYLTLMARAPCLRVSGTLRVVFPSLCVPPPSHYNRMEYHISAAAYSRPRGQMSSTRRRKPSLAADGLTLFHEIFSFIRVQVKMEPRVAKSRHRKTTDRTIPGQRYARNPPPLNGFFCSPGPFPRSPVTQSMLLVSPPFLSFDVRLSSLTTDYGFSSRSPLLMHAQSSGAGITALLGHPAKIPIRLSNPLSARRPAGDTKARGQCMQFSVRMGKGRDWEGGRTCAAVFYLQGVLPN